jgi:hypothetical protein
LSFTYKNGSGTRYPIGLNIDALRPRKHVLKDWDVYELNARDSVLATRRREDVSPSWVSVTSTQIPLAVRISDQIIPQLLVNIPFFLLLPSYLLLVTNY